ncbi:MAG: histidine kinase [Rhodothermales bacterium]
MAPGTGTSVVTTVYDATELPTLPRNPMLPRPSTSTLDASGTPFKLHAIELLGIVCFWGCIAALNIAQEAMEARPGREAGLRPGEGYYTLAEYATWAFVTPAIFWLCARFDLINPTARLLALHLVVAVVVAASVDWMTHWLWNVLVTSPWERPLTLGSVFRGFHFLPEVLLYLVVLAAGIARAYILRYRERLQETLELRAQAAALETQLAEAKLHALRMQLNPHFLFNTLHTISSNLERDPKGMRSMISRLSGLLRYTLDHSEASEVTLRQELTFLDGYLSIQQVRFAETLTVEQTIAPRVLDALVPNLILQPIVENAIKHAVSVRGAGSQLAIRAWEDEGQLWLSVQDNGPGLPTAEGDGVPASASGIGLRNTRARLETLYGTGHTLDLVPVPEGGLDVRIGLPYHTPYDLYTAAVPA